MQKQILYLATLISFVINLEIFAAPTKVKLTDTDCKSNMSPFIGSSEVKSVTEQKSIWECNLGLYIVECEIKDPVTKKKTSEITFLSSQGNIEGKIYGGENRARSDYLLINIGTKSFAYARIGMDKSTLALITKNCVGKVEYKIFSAGPGSSELEHSDCSRAYRGR